MVDTLLKPDFSGYATKADLKCSDGRTITEGAFKHMFDGRTEVKVPLVWHHIHNEPGNVLGYAILEHRDSSHPGGAGVYAYGYFNESEPAKLTKEAVRHGDVTAMSIFANNLLEKAKSVLHGVVREVSLVLSGANPGAVIDNVSIAHGEYDVDYEMHDDEAIIRMNLPLEHTGMEDSDSDEEEDETDEEDEDLEHADTEKTVQDVYDSMSDEQKEVVHYMIGAALEGADNKQSDNVQHSEDEDKEADNNVEHSDNEGDLTHQEGSNTMGTQHNVFDQNAVKADDTNRLTHEQLVGIIAEAQKPGVGFKQAVLKHADEYGIKDIEMLFPDARDVTGTPEWISRRMEWVQAVLSGTKHSPFSKVRTRQADITADEARAKGYVKGNRKVEEVFTLLQRTTGPATIYKKQKLDKDDITDITDFDVVNWLKAEMRLMIEEEVARAVLVGDNRSASNPDKVKDPQGAADGSGIRSILHDDDLYSIKPELAANVSPKDSVRGVVRSSATYKGSGSPTLFMSRVNLIEIMLEEDKFGRPMYADRGALADAMGVSNIVTVDLFDEYDNLFAIIVNLSDYTIGTTKGGELSSFEDFDIDFNQNKYLQETRLSGALTKPFSAIVITRAQGELATATQPSFNGATDTITIPDVEGVEYTINDEPVTGDVHITGPTEVVAHPELGYYLATGSTREWSYTP